MSERGVTFIIPIRTQSEANLREHWAAKAKRVKQHRGAGNLCTRAGLGGWRLELILRRPALKITMTRIAPRRLDTGNCAVSMKACQDGIADALEMDDGERRLTWIYGQRQGKPKEYGVEVMISTSGD